MREVLKVKIMEFVRYKTNRENIPIKAIHQLRTKVTVTILSLWGEVRKKI